MPTPEAPQPAAAAGASAAAGHDRFAGVMSLLLTPFDHNLAIDWTSYDRYVDWQLEQQPQGLFAVCGTSEMKWLTREERLELARRAVQRAGEVPVLATANLDPDRSAHPAELRALEDAGVAGVVLVPPDGLGADPPALEAYFAALADAAGVPVFLYEWPQVRSYFLSAESFGRLVREHGVKGIKDTTCTAAGITAKIEAAPQAIVYQANTPYLPEALAAGARGIMAITSAACADLVIAYWNAATRDVRGEDARFYHAQLVFLDAVLRQGHPLLSKRLLQRRGIDFPLACRWPQDVAPEACRALEAWHEQARPILARLGAKEEKAS